MAYLLANGGLALTDLSVRQKAGTGWSQTSVYTPNQDYRLNVRVVNLYPPTNYFGFAQRHVAYLYPVTVSIRLLGAVFNGVDADSSTLLTRSQVTGPETMNVEDNRPLQNTKSRTYHAYFKWNGKSQSTTTTIVEVYLGGGEVSVLPNMGWFPLRPAG